MRCKLVCNVLMCIKTRYNNIRILNLESHAFQNSVVFFGKTVLSVSVFYYEHAEP